MSKPYPPNKIIGYSSLLGINEYADNVESKIWVTRSGEMIYIKDLRTTHIKGILDMIIKNSWREEYKPLLEQELQDRLYAKLAKKSKMGKVLFGKNNAK